MFDSLPVRRPLAPRNRSYAAGRSIPILLHLLGRQADAVPVRPWMNPNSFLVDETGVCTAVLVDQIQRVAREIVGMAASFTFD